MHTATLQRDEIRNALAIAKHVIEKRNAIPILGNVEIIGDAGGLVMRATNLDTEVSIRLPESSSAGEFTVTIPHAVLANIEKNAKASDTIIIDAPIWEPAQKILDNAQASLDFGELKVRLETLNYHDFPDMKAADYSTSFDINSKSLLYALKQAQFTISTDETRYYLNGVYMCREDENLAFTSTDGHRMAHHVIGGIAGTEKMRGIIIPRNLVNMLCKLLKAKDAPESIHIDLDGSRAAMFSYSNVIITAKMIDGTYPNYKNIIPRGNVNHAVINIGTAIEAIKAVSAVSNERAKAIKLRFSRTAGLTISAKNYDLDTAEMTVPCVYAGNDFEIGFNARYLTEILSNLKGNSSIWELPPDMKDKQPMLGPTIIHGEDNDTLYVQMPMRV